MRPILALAAAGFLALGAPAQAAGIVTYDFAAHGGVASGAGYATTLTFNDPSGLVMTARGFSLLDIAANNPTPGFTTAAVSDYLGYGLGVCNQDEHTGCDSPSHQIDGASTGYGRTDRDFVLLQFSAPVTIIAALVQTYSGADTDVTWWSGTTAAPLDLTGKRLADLAGLGFGAAVNDSGSSGNNAQNLVGIGGGSVDSLLIGVTDANDAFKLRSLSISYTAQQPGPNPIPTAVPEPATLELLAAGLLGLGLVARRRAAPRREAVSARR